MNRKAFTLTEVLILVAIAAILFDLVFTQFGHKGTPTPVKTSEASTVTSSPYDVQLLFMIDGLKVYRFQDAGRYIYVVDGSSSKTAWNEIEMHGKTTAQVPVEVPTIK